MHISFKSWKRKFFPKISHRLERRSRHVCLSPTWRHAQCGKRLKIKPDLQLVYKLNQSGRISHSWWSFAGRRNMAATADYFPKSPDPMSRHRSQYKCSTPPWKEQYRKVRWYLRLPMTMFVIFSSQFSLLFDFISPVRDFNKRPLVFRVSFYRFSLLWS